MPSPPMPRILSFSGLRCTHDDDTNENYKWLGGAIGADGTFMPCWRPNERRATCHAQTALDMQSVQSTVPTTIPLYVCVCESEDLCLCMAYVCMCMLLLFCCYSVAILLLFCCYFVAILLLFCCYSVAILLLFCCYSVAILLLFRCGVWDIINHLMPFSAIRNWTKSTPRLKTSHHAGRSSAGAFTFTS
jgi:hypothetical protein